MIIQPFFFIIISPHSLHIRKKRDLIKYSDIFILKAEKKILEQQKVRIIHSSAHECHFIDIRMTEKHM